MQRMETMHKLSELAVHMDLEPAEELGALGGGAVGRFIITSFRNAAPSRTTGGMIV